MLAGGTAIPSSAAPATSDDITLFVAGDLLGPYSSEPDTGAAELAEIAQLIGTADAAFANHEGSSFDLKSFEGAKAAENGGGYPLHTLATMRAFKAMGLDLISRANNHATDWGLEGLVASDDALDAIGFAHAGTGRDIERAREPTYFAAHGGTVALIATSSTFPGMSPAGEKRPGLNPLHVEPITLVTKGEMKSLRSIALRGGWQGYDLPGPDATELRINEKAFRVSAKPGLTFDVSTVDRSALLESVGVARAKAPVVLFSIHAHETQSGAYEDERPADFLPPLFRDAIDRGASLIVRHGPHSVQGVEIYKGKPIFYGLGHLFFDLPRTLTAASDGPSKQVISLPEGWWEGAAATVRYSAGKLAEVRIYPLAIESRDGPRRGIPALARGTQAVAILSRIRDRSAAFGTRMRIERDVGVIDGF